MIQEKNSLSFLDMLTILSFCVGVYALYITLENLKENEEQNEELKEILNYLEVHLKAQDEHLASQDKVLENITK